VAYFLQKLFLHQQHRRQAERTRRPLHAGHASRSWDNRLSELTKYVVSGLARFQSSLGSSYEDALASAEEIDRRLEDAWVHVEDLNRAFKPWDPSRPVDPTLVQHILAEHELQLSVLVGIKGETDAEESVDWRFFVLQDADGQGHSQIDPATSRRIIQRVQAH
jgi:uncharacterized alpha-E superfamily protein